MSTNGLSLPMEDISKTDYKPAMKSNYSSDLKAGGWSKDGGSDSRELDDLHPTELPPAFSAYEANYRVRGDGHVITHDEHLNEDGEALYRFLLEQAEEKPSFQLKCHGSHEETRTRSVTSAGPNGTTTTQIETYQETVTDFDFSINLTPHILPELDGVPIFVVGDRAATFRGRTVKEVDQAAALTPEGEEDLEAAGRAALGSEFRRKATSAEKDRSTSLKNRLGGAGLPPWVLLQGEYLGTQADIESPQARSRLQNAARGGDGATGTSFDDMSLSAPSKTLRQWADEYCASRKMLKEFNFDKVVYGWDTSALHTAVRQVVKENWRYNNEPTVTFSVYPDVVSVRPHNWLSRMLSHRFVKFLLWIVLIYPLVIWPFKRFGSGGGGEWRVAGSAYAVAKWVHLEDSVPGESVEGYRSRAPNIPTLRVLRSTPRGVSRLEGTREGEWFRMWEGTIADLVRTRHVSGTVFEKPTIFGAGVSAGAALDGYH